MAGGGGGPCGGIGDDALNFGLMVGGISFMAGAEVDDATLAAGPGAAGAKNIAAFKPGYHDEFIRRGNVEEFTVHFFMRDIKVGREAIGNGVSGVDDEEAFTFAGLAPMESTASAHQFFKRLGIVCGVEKDHAHAFQRTLVDAFDDFVANFGVGHVAPPEKDVSRGKKCVGEAVIRLILSRCGDEGGRQEFFQSALESDVDTFGIDAFNYFVFEFVTEFIPDRDAKRGHEHSFQE